MLRPILRTGLTLFILSRIFPSITFTNWMALIIAAAVVTALNALGKPVLKILFLPINVITLGLFSTVINVFLLWLATYLVPGFIIHSVVLGGVTLNWFFTLLLVSVLIGFLTSLIKVLV